MKPHICILGANSDIARALAHQYARTGYSLYLAARQSQRLLEDVQDLKIRYQAEARIVEFDATDYDSHADFYASLNPQPDVVACVFGYLGEQAQAQQDWTEARRILDTNYTGAASILHHVAHAMEQRGSGTIIGISSVAGDRGRASNYLYGSAKAGFTAFLSGLRNRLAASGVHVLTVKPGFVQTAMTEGLDLPPLLTAQPEEVARDVFRAEKRKKNVVYTQWMWRYIMWVIRNIPEGIFKRMKL